VSSVDLFGIMPSQKEGLKRNCPRRTSNSTVLPQIPTTSVFSPNGRHVDLTQEHIGLKLLVKLDNLTLLVTTVVLAQFYRNYPSISLP
jgi:hypothetical protein